MGYCQRSSGRSPKLTSTELVMLPSRSLMLFSAVAERSCHRHRLSFGPPFSGNQIYLTPTQSLLLVPMLILDYHLAIEEPIQKFILMTVAQIPFLVGTYHGSPPCCLPFVPTAVV